MLARYGHRNAWIRKQINWQTGTAGGDRKCTRPRTSRWKLSRAEAKRESAFLSARPNGFSQRPAGAVAFGDERRHSALSQKRTAEEAVPCLGGRRSRTLRKTKSVRPSRTGGRQVPGAEGSFHDCDVVARTMWKVPTITAAGEAGSPAAEGRQSGQHRSTVVHASTVAQELHDGPGFLHSGLGPCGAMQSTIKQLGRRLCRAPHRTPPLTTRPHPPVGLSCLPSSATRATIVLHCPPLTPLLARATR